MTIGEVLFPYKFTPFSNEDDELFESGKVLFPYKFTPFSNLKSFEINGLLPIPCTFVVLYLPPYINI